MKPLLHFFVFLSAIFALNNSAYSRCLNGYQDISKFSGASNDCSGFFISSDLFLTTRHCLATFREKVVVRVGPVGGKYPESNFFWGTPIFHSDRLDIALIKTEKKHPYLTDEDFKCVVLSTDLSTSKDENKYIVGASRGELTIPLVFKCVEPKIENSKIICQSVGNPGQSGGALVGYNIVTDRIYVYGVFIGGLGVDVKKEFYWNSSYVIGVSDIMTFIEKNVKSNLSQ